MDSTIVTLVSSDNIYFKSELKIIKCSATLRTMIDDCGMNPGETIPVTNVNSAILEKVLVWAEHHQNDPDPPEDEDVRDHQTDNISAWDKAFLNVDQGILFDLILAANYLDIKGLLDVTCKTVANMIKGKTPEEIRRTFNIVNDLSPDEEDHIRRQNEWCERR